MSVNPALILVIAGLIICWLHEKVKQNLLSTIVYWTGIVVLVVGMILLLFPLLVWVHGQVRSMFGV